MIDYYTREPFSQNQIPQRVARASRTALVAPFRISYPVHIVRVPEREGIPSVETSRASDTPEEMSPSKDGRR